MHTAKNFDELIKIDFEDWPEKIVFGEIELDIHPSDNRNSYLVSGQLEQIWDDIDEKYSDHESSILISNMHDAIYIVVHGAARFINSLERENIRLPEVKYFFEKKILYALTCKDLDWTEKDLQQVYSYFKAEGRPLK